MSLEGREHYITVGFSGCSEEDKLEVLFKLSESFLKSWPKHHIYLQGKKLDFT